MRRSMLALVAMAALVPSTAHAYLDGGTASLIFQGIAAALFGASFAIKMYWHRLKTFFSGEKEPEPPALEEPSEPGAQ